DGTGALARGAGAGATAVTGSGTAQSPYVVKLHEDTLEANIEERDFWNYDGEDTLLEVVDYDPATQTVKLVGSSTGLAALQSGSDPVPHNKFFYMPGQKDDDPMGLSGALGATNGSTYNIPIQRRWKATQLDAGGLGFNTDMINEVVLEIHPKTGTTPNHIEMS